LLVPGTEYSLDGDIAGTLVQANKALYVSDPVSNPTTPDARFARDSSGNVTGLVGPDGGKVNLWKGNTICLVGDSITENHIVYQAITSLTQTSGVATAVAASHQLYDSQTVRVVSADESEYNGFKTVTWVNANTFIYPINSDAPASATGASFQRFDKLTDLGWFSLANAKLRSWFNVLNYAARGGRKTAEMLSSLSTEVLDYEPSWCAVLGGINDLTAGETVASVTANLQSIYEALAARNINVIAMTILPLESGHSSYSTALQEKIMEVNAWIKKQCFDNSYLFVDSFSAVVDPLSATAQPVSGMLKSDHIHPGEKGALAIANKLADTLSPLLPAIDTLVSSAADTYGTNSANENVCDNGVFSGSGGATSGTGVSGIVATSWTVKNAVGTPTSVASVDARTVSADGDTIGNNQVVTITGAASGNAVYIQSASMHSRLATGQRMYAEGHVQVSGLVAVSEISFKISIAANNGTIVAYGVCNHHPGTHTFPQDDCSYKFRTPIIQMPDPTKFGTGSPGTIANAYIIAMVKFNGSGEAVVKLGRVSLRKVS